MATKEQKMYNFTVTTLKKEKITDYLNKMIYIKKPVGSLHNHWCFRTVFSLK